MKLLVKDITSAIAKLTDFVSGDKTVPGVMLSIGNNEMYVKYSDGRKAFSERVDVETEDGDVSGDIVVDYSSLVSILSKCQPSGIIVVDYIQFNFVQTGKIDIVAEQKCLVDSESGEAEYRVLAEKTMQLNWVEVKSSLKTEILGRMNYDDIFNATITDSWDIEELIDILSRCATEKARVIYMSPSIQKVYVANLAHTTAIPVSPLEVSPMDLELLSSRLDEEGAADKYDEEAEKLYKRMKFSATISTNIAKQVCGILSKIGKGTKVYTHENHGYFSIMTEDERVGIWFQLSEGSRVHISQFEKFSSIKYDSYQMNFVREFLVDAIKSAVASTASEKLTFSFKTNEQTGETEMILMVTNSNASINDTYKVVTDDYVNLTEDKSEKQLTIALRVFDEMLSQLKSDMIALDIKNMPDGSACVRLAELDKEKAMHEYHAAREKLGLTDVDPTPVDVKAEYRERTLMATQYTLVAK